MVTSFYVDSPSVYDSASMRIAILYSPPDCIWQFIRHMMTRLSNNGTATAEALLAGREIDGAWSVLTLEVAKLLREQKQISLLLEEAMAGSGRDASVARAAFATFCVATSTMQKCFGPFDPATSYSSHADLPSERRISLAQGVAKVAQGILSYVSPLVEQRTECQCFELPHEQSTARL